MPAGNSISTKTVRHHRRGFVLGKKGQLVQMKPSIKSVQKQVNNLKRNVFDLHLTTFELEADPSSTTYSIYLINGIAQGDDVSQRSGNSIRMLNFKFRYNAIAADSSNAVRVMLIYDNNPNGALPAGADLFQNYATALTDNFASFIRFDNRKRFKTLYDKVHCVSTSGPANQPGFMNVKLNKLGRYSGAGATIASVLQGGLYVVHISDSTGAFHPSVTGKGILTWLP